MTKILIVLTSAEKTETGKPAGYYLPEAAHVRGFDTVLLIVESDTPSMATYSHTIRSFKLVSTSISPRPTAPTPLSARRALKSVY